VLPKFWEIKNILVCKKMYAVRVKHIKGGEGNELPAEVEHSETICEGSELASARAIIEGPKGPKILVY
jgi:hypothetical protein